MTVFICQERDPFDAIAEQQRARGASQGSAIDVRRPVRGLQAGKDTYAHLRVVDADGNDLDFLDSGSRHSEDGIGKSKTYSNFLLQKVGIQRSELRQFIKTFGLIYLFLFGENPIMVQVSGGLIHSPDFPWDEEWWANYDDTLRATRLAELGARAYLCYDRTLVEGYILEASTSREAATPTMAPLMFNMVATNIKFLSTIGRTEFPFDRYTVDFTKPESPLGGIMNLPVGRQLLFDTADLSAQAGRAAALPVGTQALVQFGSFSQMFTSLMQNPGLLAGIKPQGIGRQLLDTMFQTSQKPGPRGDISLNTDEYVQTAPTSSGSSLANKGTPSDRVERFQQMAEADEERPMAGDVARSVISSDDPDSINMANTAGLEGSHGVAMVDGTLDTSAPADGSSSSRPRTRPWPGARA